MKRRQWIKTKFIALLMLLAFGLSVWTHLIFRPLVLAQDTDNFYAERVINFFVENTKNFSVGFDFHDRTSTTDTNSGRRYSSSNNKAFDLKDLGKLVLNLQSSADLPEKIGLIGNRGSGEVSFSLKHELEDVEIPPHIQFNLRGEASDSDFLDQQGKLASIELTFEGLLLKGVPEYLSKTDFMKELKQQEFELKIDGDSKATLSKIVSILPGQQNLINELRDVEAKLNEKQEQIQSLISLDNGDPFRVAQIEDSKNDLKNYAIEKSRLLSQLFKNIEFPCAPEFKRVVKFPIFERSASASSSSASARAAVGVSGDVVIEIKNPTCGISMSSPFKFEAWTYADIDITSHGFFGARAEADFGITFSDQYGSYPVSLEISPEEKQAFNGLVLKMLDKAKNDDQILKSLQGKIDSKVVQISNSIENALVGDGTNITQLCSLFDKLGLKTPNSQEGLICWAFSTTIPSKPQAPNIPPLVLIPPPPLPRRPDGQCKGQLPLPLCAVKRVTVCGVCEACKWGRCIPVPCAKCSEQEIEVPLGCRAARRSTEATNASYKTLCNRIKTWESQVKQINQNWESKNKEIKAQWESKSASVRQQFQRKLAEWTELSNRWNQYRNPALVLAVAKNAVNERVLHPVDSRAVAQKLLDAAWQVNDWVDMTNDFVRNNVPETLSINVRGSARASVTSQAHILHARPKFKTSSTLDILQDGQPSLNLVFSGFQNAREDGSAGIGGLDVLGYTLSAEQEVFLGGKKLLNIKENVEDFTPTFDKGKIPLSNKEEIIYPGSYRYR